MHRVAAAVLGFAAGGIVAGGVKLFVLNLGPAAVGRPDWFPFTWLAAAITGQIAALSRTLVRGLALGLVLVFFSSLALESGPFRPPPGQRVQSHLIHAGACLVAGFVGGMIGRAVLRSPRTRPHVPEPASDPDEGE